MNDGDLRRITAAAVERDPDALAALVCDLASDRRSARRRSLDPMIRRRHDDAVAQFVSTLPLQEASDAAIRMATAAMIQETHASMVARGLLPDGEQGAMAVARTLFCATMTVPVRLAA